MRKGIELLSPAGSPEALHAAIQSGADAVYIGGRLFNARQGAKNFTIEQIRECADYCHLYGADLHIALNTLIKQCELRDALDYARELSNAGADAFIIQDLGLARLIKKACPDAVLHASTQMTVTSAEGVNYLRDMGFSRVVLARELSSRQIKEIADNTDIELEVFAHGALCMCYSGQCLMSSIIGGRSANRGRCAQPCRLPYTLTNGKESVSAYALSPKDLALIGELDELKKIGVSSIKIEGRLKRPEYVSAVTGIYRKYLDFPARVSREDMDELKNAFSRSGFTQGYFKAQTGKAMMSHKNPGNTTGDVFSEAAKKRAAENANIRKIKLAMQCIIRENDVIYLTVSDDDFNSVTVSGSEIIRRADVKPTDRERIAEQLKKLGATPFVCSEPEIYSDEGLAVPIREINSVRREAAQKLIKVREQREIKPFGETDFIENRGKKHDGILLTAECETEAQALAADKAGADIIYVKDKIAAKIRRRVSADVVASANAVFDGEKIKCCGVLIENTAGLRFYADKKIYAGHRLNIFNAETADIFKAAELVTLSPELNLREIRDITKTTDISAELIAYGRVTLMVTENCPVRALGKCAEHRSDFKLRDRKNEEFPILCSDDCRARIVNSKPVFMADKLSELINAGARAIRLVFTVESGGEAKEITELYRAALRGGKAANIFENNMFTRGHYYRGVE